MTSGFKSLGDDGIAALVFQPSGLFDGRGRRQDTRTGSPDPIKQRSWRKAKMKAHNGRLQFDDYVAHEFIKRHTIRNDCSRGGIDSEFRIVTL
jgi:hypothetical protein